VVRVVKKPAPPPVSDVSYLADIARFDMDVAAREPRWSARTFLPQAKEVSPQLGSPRPRTTGLSLRPLGMTPREGLFPHGESRMLSQLIQTFGTDIPNSAVPEQFHVHQAPPLATDSRKVCCCRFMNV
jgi:hypothetical protein